MHGPMLRTIIWMILCAKENAFWVLLGVVCSSWVSINRGTSKRSILCPSGDERHQYVKDANNMVSRFPGYWVYIYIWRGIVMSVQDLTELVCGKTGVVC